MAESQSDSTKSSVRYRTYNGSAVPQRSKRLAEFFPNHSPVKMPHPDLELVGAIPHKAFARDNLGVLKVSPTRRSSNVGPLPQVDDDIVAYAGAGPGKGVVIHDALKRTPEAPDTAQVVAPRAIATPLGENKTPFGRVQGRGVLTQKQRRLWRAAFVLQRECPDEHSRGEIGLHHIAWPEAVRQRTKASAHREKALSTLSGWSLCAFSCIVEISAVPTWRAAD